MAADPVVLDVTLSSQAVWLTCGPTGKEFGCSVWEQGQTDLTTSAAKAFSVVTYGELNELLKKPRQQGNSLPSRGLLAFSRLTVTEQESKFRVIPVEFLPDDVVGFTDIGLQLGPLGLAAFADAEVEVYHGVLHEGGFSAPTAVFVNIRL